MQLISLQRLLVPKAYCFLYHQAKLLVGFICFLTIPFAGRSIFLLVYRCTLLQFSEDVICFLICSSLKLFTTANDLWCAFFFFSWWINYAFDLWLSYILTCWYDFIGNIYFSVVCFVYHFWSWLVIFRCQLPCKLLPSVSEAVWFNFYFCL